MLMKVWKFLGFFIYLSIILTDVIVTDTLEVKMQFCNSEVLWKIFML